MSKELIPTSNVLVTNDEMLKELKKVLDSITKHHKTVSQKKTPKGFIKQKMGYDYVEDAYMRRIGNEEYPGWSFTVIGSEIVGNVAMPKSMALKVHGRLKFFDNGIWREGDMVAAHRIQFKKNDPEEVVDMGNDFKAAVTDCMKKAMNTYMNIADDVYRKADPTLSQDEVELLEKLADEAQIKDKIKAQIKDGEINKLNLEPAIRRLKRLIEESNAQS